MRDPALKMRAGDAKVLEYSAFAYNGTIIIGEKWQRTASYRQSNASVASGKPNFESVPDF